MPDKDPHNDLGLKLGVTAELASTNMVALTMQLVALVKSAQVVSLRNTAQEAVTAARFAAQHLQRYATSVTKLADDATTSAYHIEKAFVVLASTSEGATLDAKVAAECRDMLSENTAALNEAVNKLLSSIDPNNLSSIETLLAGQLSKGEVPLLLHTDDSHTTQLS